MQDREVAASAASRLGMGLLCKTPGELRDPFLEVGLPLIGQGTRQGLWCPQTYWLCSWITLASRLGQISILVLA